jgi:hypothetical protein
MARPGREPGTPRFSALRTNASNNPKLVLVERSGRLPLCGAYALFAIFCLAIGYRARRRYPMGEGISPASRRVDNVLYPRPGEVVARQLADELEQIAARRHDAVVDVPWSARAGWRRAGQTVGEPRSKWTCVFPPCVR